MIYTVPDNQVVFRTVPSTLKGSYGGWHVQKSNKLATCGYLPGADDVEFTTLIKTKKKNGFCVKCFPKHLERAN